MIIKTSDFNPEAENFAEVVARQEKLMKFLSVLSERDSEIAFYFLMGAMSSIIANVDEANQMAALKILNATYEQLIEMTTKKEVN